MGKLPTLVLPHRIPSNILICTVDAFYNDKKMCVLKSGDVCQSLAFTTLSHLKTQDALFVYHHRGTI